MRTDITGGGAGSAWLDLISDELSAVQELMVSQLRSGAKADEIRRLVDHVSGRGGKMVRPALVMLSGLTSGRLESQHVLAGAIIEMIHNATLLHDDVIDEGQTRRGLPTVNKMWGNEPAVLLGDYLLSQAFRMCADLERETAKIIAEATTRVCEGELRQVTEKNNWDLGEAEYLDIITEKSASLFAGSCRVGSFLSGGSRKDIEAVEEFGLNVGITFQITDDLLDLTGDESKTGKTLGTDIEKDKPTLALIHMLAVADEQQKTSIRAILADGGSREEFAGFLESTGSLDYSRAKAAEYGKRAVDCLNRLGESRARSVLLDLAEQLIERTC